MPTGFFVVEVVCLVGFFVLWGFGLFCFLFFLVCWFFFFFFSLAPFFQNVLRSWIIFFIPGFLSLIGVWSMCLQSGENDLGSVS